MGISREALRKKLIMSDDVIAQLKNPQAKPAPVVIEKEVEDQEEAA